MNYKETFKEAWQLTEEGMNSGMADWRFYAGAVICIGAILLTHLFVYRFPDLLVPFIVALALSGVLIALDVLTERGQRLDVLRERERRSWRLVIFDNSSFHLLG